MSETVTAISQPATYVLTAGGTGGHVFPAQALASALVARGHRVVLITDDRGTRWKGPLAELETHHVPAATVQGRNPINYLKAAWNIIKGIRAARQILRTLSPAAVVGFGGYPSLPAMFAARLEKIPTVIHEQNAVLGRANRLLASSVDAIAAALPEMDKVKLRDWNKITVVGNPVRPEILAKANQKMVNPNGSGELRVLILGGSQGATVLSQVIPAALDTLPASLKFRLRLTQQCRAEDIDQVRLLYQQSNIHAELATFIDNVPQKMADAHLVISRAGASTIAEIAVIGRPAILVPYPHAMDDHQSYNARALAKTAGAWMIRQDDFTPDRLVLRLTEIFSKPSQLSLCGDKVRAAGRPHAAEALADLVEQVAQKFRRVRPGVAAPVKSASQMAERVAA